MQESLVRLRQRIESESGNKYPTLQETEIERFEKNYNIKLPIEFRQCLSHVSNGAHGGIFRLGEMDSGFDFTQWAEGDGFIGQLSHPFPFTKPWNDLSCKPLPDQDNSDAKWAKFEATYFRPIDGALPIAHLGCAIRHWIVVTGTERGSIWEDDRANMQGFFPLDNHDGRRMTYIQWLDWQLSDE